MKAQTMDTAIGSREREAIGKVGGLNGRVVDRGVGDDPVIIVKCFFDSE